MIAPTPTNPSRSEVTKDQPPAPEAPSGAAPGAANELKTEKLDASLGPAPSTADPLPAMLALHIASMSNLAQRMINEMGAAADQAGGLLPLLADDAMPLEMTLRLERQCERFMQIVCVQQKLALERGTRSAELRLQAHNATSSRPSGVMRR